MTNYLKTPRSLFLKILEVICEFRQVAGYKINTQKSIIFLYTSNEHVDTEIKNTIPVDFPGGPVVKNPPSNAGDAGSIPDRGTRIPHATGHLSLHTTITEPTHHNYRAHAF